MAEQNSFRTDGLQELARREGLRFCYLVSRDSRTGAYALGVMDPTDPKSWRGEISDVILYFQITPEEYAWLNTDCGRLDHLADRIQEEMPKNRFYAGYSRIRLERKELNRRCQSLLKEESLGEDEAFAHWKEQQTPSLLRQEHTPLTVARHELALFQKECAAATASALDREEEQRRQRTLGFRLMESPSLFVALDRCSPRGFWPGADPRTGEGFLFTDRALAQTACEFYEHHQLHYFSVQEVKRADYGQFFQNCEMMGIHRFRLDDCAEQVVIERKNLCPDRESTWLEEHNQGLRNAMLHSASLSTQLRTHMNEVAVVRREQIRTQAVKWRRTMLEQLRDALLYVPVLLPPEVHKALEKDYVYTEQAFEQLSACLLRLKRPESAKVPPGFSGRAVSIRANRTRRNVQTNEEWQEEGRFPLRVLTTENEERWILAFTSETLCRTFISQHHHTDTMLIATFEEISQQMGSVSGILIDLMGLGIQLRDRDIRQLSQMKEAVFPPPADSEGTARSTPAGQPALPPERSDSAGGTPPGDPERDGGNADTECKPRRPAAEEKKHFLDRFKGRNHPGPQNPEEASDAGRGAAPGET